MCPSALEPFFTSIPRSVGVEITSRCNLACRHCFNRSGEDPVQELSLPDISYVFAQMREMGLNTVRLSGGEPTLHPDFPEIVATATREGLRVSINTHGLYSSRTRQQIADLPIAHFIVSLDGMKDANDAIRGQGVFGRVVDTVTWLRGLDRAVTLGVHLGSSSIGDVAELVALAVRLGTGIKFSPLRPIGRARQYLQEEFLSPAEFYRAMQSITACRAEYPLAHITTDFDILRSVGPSSETPTPDLLCCPAGRTMLNVNYDGYIYPCAFLVTAQREWAAGHLRDAPLLTIWRESSIFGPFRNLQKDAKCQHCFAYGRTCVGGCLATAYFTSGRLDAHDPTCFIDYVPASAQKAAAHDTRVPA